MVLSTQPYKGARDFYPEDMRLQKWLFSKWREVCEQFGYEEYNGPILEPFELFASKTSDEIVNEQTYNFTDRGGREVVMRPEMTPTVSRMVAAKRQELGYPLRLYSIVNCFRYERPQKGRTREFWQLNADLFGVNGVEADAEMILLADNIMKVFGATEEMYEIQISSRKIITDIVDELKLDAQQQKTIVSLIDKKEKVNASDWEELFYDMLGKEQAVRLLTFLKEESVPENAQKIIDTLKKHGVTNVVFNRYIARGFEYYTDTVFEVFDKDPDNNRSMFGGGRYDGLVGQFGVEPVPTVGFGMGDMTLLNFLKAHDLLPDLQTETDVYVAIVGEVDSSKPVSELRAAGLNVAVDFSGNKLDKQIKNADKKRVQHVLFIGEEELKNNEFSLKNIQTGEEKKLSLNDVVQELKR